MGYLSIAAHAPGKLCFKCGGPSLYQTPQAGGVTAQGWAVLWEAAWWPSLVMAAVSRPAPEHSTEPPHHGEAGSRLFICDKCSQLCSQIALYSFLFIFFLLSFWLGWWRTERKCIPAKLPLLDLQGPCSSLLAGLGLTMSCDCFIFLKPFLHLNLQIRCQIIFFPLQYCKTGITPQPFWDLLGMARDATNSF